MKKCYIALGGIGCRNLIELEKQRHAEGEALYLYADSDPASLPKMPEHRFCPVMDDNPAYDFGFFYVRAARLIDEFMAEDHEKPLELIFVTSSFGTFGAKYLLQVARALIDRLYDMNAAGYIRARMIAYSHLCLAHLLPPMIISAMKSRSAKLARTHNEDPGFARRIPLRIVCPANPEDMCRIPAMTDDELAPIDTYASLVSAAVHEEMPLPKKTASPAPVMPAKTFTGDPRIDWRMGDLPVPYRGAEPYIFISYPHKRGAEVMPFIRRMQEMGFRIWYDEGIDPGSEWDEYIALQVRNCGFFIAMIVEEYLESSNCKDEFSYARDLEKGRMMVYLEEVILPPGMQMRSGRLQNIHKYCYPTEDGFYAKLLETRGIEVCLDSGKKGDQP